jgi:uncharacterized protein (DUF736 family)
MKIFSEKNAVIFKFIEIIIFSVLCACSLIPSDKNQGVKEPYHRISFSSENIYGIWERIGTLGMGTSYLAILNGCNVGRVYLSMDNVHLSQKNILQAINNGKIEGGRTTRWMRCNVDDGKFMAVPNGEHGYLANYMVYRDSPRNGEASQFDEMSMVLWYPNWKGGPRPPSPPPPENYRRVID